jgi:hypothetical protein
MPFLFVGEAAQELGCDPKLLTDWLYLRRLDVSRCPLLGNRRLIPRDYLPQIQRMISRRKG